MHAFIRKGDGLREAGGEVLKGHYLCDGEPIASKGDAVRCNRSARGTYPGTPAPELGKRACNCGKNPDGKALADGRQSGDAS